MAEGVFADPYERVRGTGMEPCSPRDRAVALAMNRSSRSASASGLGASPQSFRRRSA